MSLFLNYSAFIIFINELAQIVKTYRYDTQSIDYRFHFKQLNLDIVLSKQEDLLLFVYLLRMLHCNKILIRIQAYVKVLQDKLDTNDIDLFFDFYSFDGFSQQQQSSQQNEESRMNQIIMKDSDEISIINFHSYICFILERATKNVFKVI